MTPLVPHAARPDAKQHTISGTMAKETVIPPEPSASSLRALDALNFFMADVQGGVGPYLSVYLKGGQHWQPGPIGIAMATTNIAAAVCQIPAGLVVDAARAKRLMVVLSGGMVVVGCLLTVLFPQFAVIVATQAILGAASALISPLLAALSLGLVGRQCFPARISRNETFNHGGNFAAAALVGTLGQRLGYHWIFYFVLLFGVASSAAVVFIRPKEINHELARGEDDGRAGLQPDPMPLRDLLQMRNLLVFLASVILFHFGNAAMLPMAGQVLAKTHPHADTASLSACIITAQLVMVGVAAASGWAMKHGVGRKRIFLVALAVLPVRGVLFSLSDSPGEVITIQLLDGVAAGIFGVISVVIAADLTRGTGRFNLTQGLVALATGIGAGMSNLLAGFVVQGFDYKTGFLTLAVIAVAAFAFFAIFMPETRPET